MKISKRFERIKEKFKDEIDRQMINNFDEMYKSAVEYAEKTILEEVNRAGFRKSKIRVIEDILADEIIYKSKGFLSNIDKTEYVDYYKYQYTERTRQFRESHGSEQIKYGKITRTIDDWYDFYLEGKISQNAMNKIIKKYKNSPQKYKAGS